MKIRVADATGCPVPQFVIEAEDERDRMLLKAFISFPQEAKDTWKFHLHGYGCEGGKDGYTTFNFGWSRIEPEVAPPGAQEEGR